MCQPWSGLQPSVPLNPPPSPPKSSVLRIEYWLNQGLTNPVHHQADSEDVSFLPLHVSATRQDECCRSSVFRTCTPPSAPTLRVPTHLTYLYLSLQLLIQHLSPTSKASTFVKTVEWSLPAYRASPKSNPPTLLLPPAVHFRLNPWRSAGECLRARLPLSSRTRC